MARPVVPDTSQACIWASAGILTYKLCDRDFDCEHCTLDVALRGGSLGIAPYRALLAPGPGPRVFPEDRLYTTGHSWLQAIGGPDDRRWRFGLDAFAAAIIARCSEVRWQVSDRLLARGETFCQIDLELGMLSVGAPLRGAVVDGNRALRDAPCRLVTAPYGEGWILDLMAVDLSEIDGLLTAEAASQNARLDLQRFRRRVALQLLADTVDRDRSLPDGGELVADLRQMLGGPAYLNLVRELIH